MNIKRFEVDTHARAHQDVGGLNFTNPSRNTISSQTNPKIYKTTITYIHVLSGSVLDCLKRE